MEWSPLAGRFNNLPLILAGPILRRTESNSVTVWVALKERKNVTLTISDASTPTVGILRGQRTTVQLGPNLHVVAVTATPIGTQVLQPGQTYVYDLNFDGSSLRDANILNRAGSYEGFNLTYEGGPGLPSFSLPPNDLNQLRIVHGSCRKPHGNSGDLLIALDMMIDPSSSGTGIDPLRRPHQFFMTGDQIYADDVADALLHMLHDAEQHLLGGTDALTGSLAADDLKPGGRAALATNTAGFTGTFIDKLELAKSHLLTLGEYYAMYLFVWSDVLWPSNLDLPTFEQTRPRGTDEDTYDEEKERLGWFRNVLRRVRRAFANVPSYMIFDDHDVTDDWVLNKRWCIRVFEHDPGRGGVGGRLGRHVVQNGLLAYALFQAWGNDPAQFETGRPGARLLELTEHLGEQIRPGGNQFNVRVDLAPILKVPYTNDQWNEFRQELDTNRRPPQPAATSMIWNYTITGPKHEVLILDTRTERGYPGEAGFANLLNEPAFQRQISNIRRSVSAEVVIVVSAAPVLGIPSIEDAQRDAATGGPRFDKDTEAWRLGPRAVERLLAALAGRQYAAPLPGTDSTAPPIYQQVVFLSGDVHMGSAARLQYWADDLWTIPGTRNIELIAAQLTSSSLRNETYVGSGPLGQYGTISVHSRGYNFLETDDSLPEPIYVSGWANTGGGRLLVGRKNGQDWNPEGHPIIAVQSDFESYDFTTRPPTWQNRTDYILAEWELEGAPPPRFVDPQRAPRHEALRSYLNRAANHRDYVGEYGNGKEIVGLNNIGEITFLWPASGSRVAIQTLWWRLQSERGSNLLEPHPLSRFEISLNFTDSAYRRPPLSG